MTDTIIQSPWFLSAVAIAVVGVLLWGRVRASSLLGWLRTAPQPPDALDKARWVAEGTELFRSDAVARRHLDALWACCKPRDPAEGEPS